MLMLTLMPMFVSRDSLYLLVSGGAEVRETEKEIKTVSLRSSGMRKNIGCLFWVKMGGRESR